MRILLREQLFAALHARSSTENSSPPDKNFEKVG
jgi:hypothetical protein